MEISDITQVFAKPINKHGLNNKNREYVGHVEKKIRTRFCGVKEDKTNKGICGKGAGKLIDNVIQEMTKFYGLAIRRYPGSLEEMKK
ncbi:unnamed protein product [Euphydryas editha]|nr:unnamed protein product [Euphydryas editha]